MLPCGWLPTQNNVYHQGCMWPFVTLCGLFLPWFMRHTVALLLFTAAEQHQGVSKQNTLSNSQQNSQAIHKHVDDSTDSRNNTGPGRTKNERTTTKKEQQSNTSRDITRRASHAIRHHTHTFSSLHSTHFPIHTLQCHEKYISIHALFQYTRCFNTCAASPNAQ